MNELGYPPRMWAYSTALDLSEVIGYHVLRGGGAGDKAEAERFADEQWKLVSRLDALSRNRTNRRLPEILQAMAELRAHAARLVMTDAARGFVNGKLDEIDAALMEVAAEGKMPRVQQAIRERA